MLSIIEYLSNNLVVDRGNRAKITFDDAFPGFSGHFHDNPLLPGACLLDAAVMAIDMTMKKHLHLRSVIKAKFTNPVRPGDEVIFTIEVSSNLNRFKVSCASNDSRVCEFLLEFEHHAE